MSECFWVLLPSLFVFWERDAFKMSRRIEKPKSPTRMFMWFKEKGTQVPFAFLTALHFMKTMIGLVERTRSNKRTTSSFGVHRYKRDAAWGNYSTPKNKPTMKHNATSGKYKANNVITSWSLRGDGSVIRQIWVCGLTRGWWRGEGREEGESTTKKT